MSGLILFISVTVFGFVEKVGLGVGGVYLQPEDVWGKEFSIFLTSEKLDYNLSGEISIGYWDAGRTLSTRKLNWNGIFGGTGLRWYPWEECIYFGGNINFYTVWMKDEHTPTNVIDEFKGGGLALSFPALGIEFPMTEKILGDIRGGVKYSFPLYGNKEVSNHNFPMYYIRANIGYML